MAGLPRLKMATLTTQSHRVSYTDQPEDAARTLLDRSARSPLPLLASFGREASEWLARRLSAGPAVPTSGRRMGRPCAVGCPLPAGTLPDRSDHVVFSPVYGSQSN
jgi:hypothetical protein